jgi:cobalt/nickel transport protein
MKLWKKNLLLLLLVAVITIVPLYIAKGSEFGGADGAAEGVIAEINSDYKPWANPLFEPASGEIESMLFALQAAIGAGIVGFGFGRLSATYKNKASEKK